MNTNVVFKINFWLKYFSCIFFRHKKGFGVLEILLSSSIFILLLVSVTGLLLYGRDSLSKDNLSSRASLLANEGMMAVESIRNSDFAGLSDGVHGLVFSGGEWNFSGQYDETAGFRRVVTISTISEKEKKAVVEISWTKKFNRLGRVILSKHFTDWAKIDLGPTIWWDNNWNCRQNIIIDNSSASQSFSNYQLLLTFNTAELISQGKIKSDCSDIRIVDYSGNVELPHWIEPSTCNTVETKIWTKVSTITNSANNNIYLYYNNSLADSVSATSSVFVREINGGLILDFSMDEGAGSIVEDSSGNNNAGSISGASREIGLLNDSLRFDGINDYVNVSDSASLNMTDEITLASWVRWNINPASGAQWSSIINKNVDNQYRLHHSSNNSSFEFAIRTSAGNRWAASSAPPLQGVWQFVVGTYDGATLKIYVNGQLSGQATWSGNLVTSNSDLRLGSRSSNDRYFNGNIDKTQIYNKALLAEEILDLYNNYGYATPNYPNNVLIKKYYDSEPIISFEAESCLPPAPIIDYNINITSDWGTGYCADVIVSTDSASPIIWQTDLLLDTAPIDGIPYTAWEVDWSFSEPILSVSGLAYNNEVSIGNPVVFGYCANRPEIIYPDEEANYSITIDSDWGSGYCATVNVSTNSVTPIAWFVNVDLSTAPENGTPYSVWNANWSFTEPILNASGLSYNKNILSGSPTSFGYCANRPLPQADYLSVDTSGAYVGSGNPNNRSVYNIFLTNNSSNSLTLTSIRLTWTGGSRLRETILSGTSVASNNNSPYTINFSNYIINSSDIYTLGFRFQNDFRNRTINSIVFNFSDGSSKTVGPISF
ncbi:MAG TPA: DUF2341 domain-containing protein [bacterium]|nr:DUF2341 domain-containing protein [bacterium]